MTEAKRIQQLIERLNTAESRMLGDVVTIIVNKDEIDLLRTALETREWVREMIGRMEDDGK